MTLDLERVRPAPIAALAIALALLMRTDALAQSRTFYDSSGRMSDRSMKSNF